MPSTADAAMLVDTGFGRREVAACQDRRADAGERFFRRSAHQGRFAERKAMIDRAHDLPIAKQAEALNISRGSVSYLPRPVSETDPRSCGGSTGCGAGVFKAPLSSKHSPRSPPKL